MASTILGSWKEIAAYLGKGVRTVQRWEQELALPVRRPRDGNRQVVVAISSEIDSWLQVQLGVRGDGDSRSAASSTGNGLSPPSDEAPRTMPVESSRGTAPLVLVVDDNEVQRYIVTRSLQLRGFRTLVASTGGEGFRLAVEQKPDLVLSDIVLPDTTGLDLCRRIRQVQKLSRTAIVFYSALTATDCENHGGDAFITYPVSDDTLTQVLQGVLRRYARGASNNSSALRSASGKSPS